jgi:hypothetical protein
MPRRRSQLGVATTPAPDDIEELAEPDAKRHKPSSPVVKKEHPSPKTRRGSNLTANKSPQLSSKSTKTYGEVNLAEPLFAWNTDYNKFIHPATLALFSQVQVSAF